MVRAWKRTKDLQKTSGRKRFLMSKNAFQKSNIFWAGSCVWNSGDASWDECLMNEGRVCMSQLRRSDFSLWTSRWKVEVIVFKSFTFMGPSSLKINLNFSAQLRSQRIIPEFLWFPLSWMSFLLKYWLIVNTSSSAVLSIMSVFCGFTNLEFGLRSLQNRQQLLIETDKRQPVSVSVSWCQFVG